jgi:predicted ABC-type exoprotein transport system permease subunit
LRLVLVLLLLLGIGALVYLKFVRKAEESAGEIGGASNPHVSVGATLDDNEDDDD